MTKAELIERVARSRNLPPNVSKKDVAKILGLAFEEISSYFAKAKVTRTHSPRFTFPRFGTFTKKKRSARRGVNPRTLEPIQIDACHILDFKASRELREAMNAAVSAAPRSRGEAKPKPKARSSRAVESNRTAERKRRLTPRDEDAELDALIDDEALFDEPALPAAPLQRARPRDNSRARNTG
jgi:nucleoid DNA-binding protein